uniref:Serine protease subunit NS2B n=1 Tax=Dengue virus type 3 (strain Singapore/8120/1995) TaxID=408693 RepID=UPI0002330299|nr:Chain A, Serine protease subunit NS2B [Dengue virus 3 Singapore/8120/1995]3U1I_C Chain C, Serine protease subunit NS2B [Dengue virus 3 Singapore/8120/1995]3U1J_A Chain A, Serine protease subunit NS2B [Dengue virus 3 Singapore/8120/1995]
GPLGSDLTVEKAADVTWEEEAEQTGVSHNLMITVDDDGTMRIKDDETENIL